LSTEGLLEAIEKAVEAKADEPLRTHLGASVVGEECMRAVWFSFHWFDYEVFPGRMLRLFERGQREEDVFTELLRNVGATVWTIDPNTQKQFLVSYFGGHYGGSCDGVAIGLPGLPPNMPVLLEEKTHNDKSFKHLQKHGVKESKPKHWKQAQVYMLGLNIDLCLYMAVNKNDDMLHLEYIQRDTSAGHHSTMRAKSIIFSDGVPPRISETPAFFKCRFCTFADVCHNRKKPLVNCRTCRYARPLESGEWSCTVGGTAITESPKTGCSFHAFKPPYDDHT
jgi:hypothetical protein